LGKTSLRDDLDVKLEEVKLHVSHAPNPGDIAYLKKIFSQRKHRNGLGTLTAALMTVLTSSKL
jgi:hypothetical protein